MSLSHLDSLKIKAKLLQKAKKKSGKLIKLREVYELLAKYAGFSSWRELRSVISRDDELCPPGGRAYWNTWYGSYEEARRHIDAAGGYLLPFRNQYFICDVHYIERLGLDPADPDIARVGPDWVSPRDEKAFSRLKEKIRAKKPHIETGIDPDVE